MCKKHVTDFTKDEKKYIIHMINEIKEPKIRIHALGRMLQKRISSDKVYDVFNNYEIIEYNKTCGEHRVLLRGLKTHGTRNISISVDLLNKEVVTAYSNCQSDNHSSLNQDKYIRKLNIIREIEKQKQLINNNNKYKREELKC